MTIVELPGPFKYVFNIQALKIWDANIFNIITFDEHFLVGHDVTAMVDCYSGVGGQIRLALAGEEPVDL